MRHLRGRARFEPMVHLRTFAQFNFTLVASGMWLFGVLKVLRHVLSLSLFFFNSRLSHNHTTSFNTTTYFQLHKLLTATNIFERRLSRPSTHSLHTQHPPVIQKLCFRDKRNDEQVPASRPVSQPSPQTMSKASSRSQKKEKALGTATVSTERKSGSSKHDRNTSQTDTAATSSYWAAIGMPFFYGAIR